MTISLGIPDDQVALGKYANPVLEAIKKGSGKFGMLDIIGKDMELKKRLKRLGIVVGAMDPIVLPANIQADDAFFAKLDRNTSKIPNSLYNYIEDDAFHIRGGSPGDMKGLVDVMHTPVIKNATRDTILRAIEEVRNSAISQTKEIQHYADNEGVYWDPRNIQIGVVPSLNVPIVTVTEDPNREERLFIDTLYPTWTGNRQMRREDYMEKIAQKERKEDIKATDLDIFGTNGLKNRLGGNEVGPEGKNIKQAIELLKQSGILDPDMTYQFEFGWIQGPPSQLVLFQVKEFAKKNRVDTDQIRSANYQTMRALSYSGIINRIITGMHDGESLDIPIIDGQNRWNIWESTRGNTYENGFVARPYRNSDDLWTSDYHLGLRGFIHGDAHGGTLAHNSFRFAQSVVRKGGIILLGNAGSFPDTPSLKTIQMHVENGILQSASNSDLPPLLDSSGGKRK